jgi:hypothetical protein
VALLIAVGVAVLAIVTHLILQRRAAHAPELAPMPAPPAEPPPVSDGELPPISVEVVGRTELLDRLDELATAADGESSASSAIARAAALVGAAAIGKTALAIDFAESTRPPAGESLDDDDFPDGRIYFEVGASLGAAVDDETLHLSFARAVLGRAASSLNDEELKSRLAAALTERRLLVILDDVRDGAQIRPLLSIHPGPRRAFVIVTSRAPLGVDGVVELSVGGLDAKSAAEILDGRVEDDDVDVEEHQAAVAALRASLEGHPLALAIAQAAIVTRTVSAIALRDEVAARRDSAPPIVAVRDALTALDPTLAEHLRALTAATSSRPISEDEAASLVGSGHRLFALEELELLEMRWGPDGRPHLRVPAALRWGHSPGS